ncbi:MAG: hypothetical protein H0X33_14405 [Taibaiella sp.]|nr:hypothetical protein [Taibaiella sp.]
MAQRDRTTLKGYFITGAQPTQPQFSDLLDSVFLKNDTVPVGNITYGIGTLTDGTTITWDFNTIGSNATVTIGGNRTLSISNMQAGQYGLIVVHQDATGSRTLILPAGSKVAGSGAGLAVLSTAPNSIDILSVFYDGTNYFWLVNQSFT